MNIRNTAVTTLPELVRLQATLQGDKIALTFLADGEIETASLTYAELDARARALATELLTHVEPGTRACLFYPPGLDYVIALFGCLYAGVIAVPGYPPRSRRRLQRLEALIEDPANLIALTNQATRTLIESALDTAPASFKQLRWLVTGAGTEETGRPWREPQLDPEAIAIVQYTSGSTSTPRGVMLTHRGLIHNIGQIEERFGLTSDSRCVTWLPPYHDMGLIGSLLTAVCAGVFTVHMSPAAFTQRPARWLEAISRYRATVSGGPNSAYELCTARVSAEDRAKLDLSSWQFAFNGAESVRPATLERFEAAFGPRGFRRSAWVPCYGLAEATLMVTARQHGNGPSVVTFGHSTIPLAGCGPVIGDTELRIVDPERLTVCPPDRVGEIWVAGRSVAQGYWNRDEESEATFHARLAGDARHYLRTGDLGQMLQGELFVTGRLKDLIIIHGANHYPQDIEASAADSHPALRAASTAAFAVDGSDGDRLVIVQELEPRAPLVADEVFLAVRKAVADEHGIDASAIVLVKSGAIPRTSSGKIRRHACRAAFLDGTLEPVAQWPSGASTASVPVAAAAGRSEDEIHHWLTSHIANRLGLSETAVDPTQAFVDYGLESSDAVGLILELEAWLGRPVSPTVVWDFPNIELLTRELSRDRETQLEPVRASAAADHSDPIAVVGIGCRFPGAENPEAFWRLLRDGRSAISEVPEGRWDLSPWREAGRDTPETSAARWGGFLDQVDQFDPYFFGIVPREATTMDPQQRLLMEVAWEALEDAGIPPASLAGSRTGVFVGISSLDYARGQSDAALDVYTGTGNALSIASNRLSYFLDLKGPSLAVDTACSSSLTSVHLACQSLQRGESTMALAGGVNLLLAPEASIVFAQARMLAPDGICKAFDASANGYVRAEGCGVIVLKRLSDAVRDGDRIAGVILATSLNQDGRSNGLTAPNGPSQRAVIQDALQQASVAPAEVGYVEAHGTGTPLGDPIEVQSLVSIFGARAAGDIPCWTGSLKANIGHLEPAAGIASLIKALLALRHGEIPPQINVRQLNPHLGLDNTRVQIPLVPQSWPRGPQRRVAGVSSFGFGGTNACVVVSEAPAADIVDATADDPLHLFTLSARSDTALRTLAALYAGTLHSTGTAIADFCYSANTGRNHFASRFACIVDSREELEAALTAFARGGSPTALAHREARLEQVRDGFLRGDLIDWAAHYGGRNRTRVALPTYPFERERYWVTPSLAASFTAAAAESEDEPAQTRPLLGGRIRTAVPVFEGLVSTDTLGYLNDHVLHGQAVFPAGAYLEMALEAALEEGIGRSLELADVVFSRAMFLSGAPPRAMQLVLWNLSPAGDEDRGTGFEIFSRPSGTAAEFDWVSHARGRILPEERAHGLRSSASLDEARTRCTSAVDVAGWYEHSKQQGLEYGLDFRGLKQAWRGAGEAVGFVEIGGSQAAVAGDYAIHPAFMDACFHVFGAAATNGSEHGLFLPVRVDGFRFHGGSASRGWVHASVSSGAGLGSATGEIAVFDTDGTLVFEAWGFTLQRLEARATAAVTTAADESRFDNSDLELTWERCERPPATELPSGHWVILSDDATGGEELSAALQHAGATCDVRPRNAAMHVAAAGELAGVVFMAPSPGSSGDEEVETLCGDALRVVQALARREHGHPPRLWLVTRGARVLEGDSPADVSQPGVMQASVCGLGSVIALEAPSLRCTRVDLDPAGGYGELLNELAFADGENEIALRGGNRFAARLTIPAARALELDGVPRSESWTLTASVPGDLDMLRLAPTLRRAPAAGEVEIQVVAAGLNFSDVMKAMGLYPGATASNMILGAECSGIVSRVGTGVETLQPGDEVMAIAPHAFSPLVCTDASLVVRKPALLQFEEAAASPIAFLTAAYALERLARLGKGERVLIHAATGGVGLAAIQIAQRAGAEIFATAGSAEKRSLLESMGLAGVFDSRSLDFAPAIRARTGGYGVDVVLNSLSGEALTASLELLAPHGRFLEIGKSDIYQNRRVSLKPFQQAISFFAIDLDRMFRERTEEVQSLFAEIADALSNGDLKPLPLRVFPMTEASQAFRHMAQAKHIGKIVLSPPRRRHEDGYVTTPLVHGDATYLVTGGTGALGLQVAGWLAGMGVRHLVLVSRSGGTAAAEATLHELRNMGVEVVVHRADIGQRDDVTRLMAAIDGMPPLRGVIHAAGVLADAALVNLTPERVHAVLAPKATAAWHLHELTRPLPLDFFILFSSLASVTGSPGQGNYAAANACLDSLAQYRRSVGLPAVSINWGPWADAGMAASGAVNRGPLEGLRPLPPTEALERMESALRSNPPAQVVIASADWPHLASGVRLQAPPPLLSHLRAALTQPAAPSNGQGSSNGLSRATLMARAAEERAGVLELHIREQISRVSGIPVARVDTQQSLGELGIDSLTSLELFNHLEQVLQVNVPAALMTADLNIASLAGHLTKQLLAH